jgi:hypothetical protein
MHLERARTGAGGFHFAAAAWAKLLRWKSMIMQATPAFCRRVAGSKAFWAILAAAAAVVVVATLKFSTILHGLVRLANVGRNVNAPGAAGVGAAGAGAAGGAANNLPGPKPAPLPTPDPTPRPLR